MKPNAEPIAPLPAAEIPRKRYFAIGEVSEICGIKPHVLPDAALATRISFVMVAVWWALFAIPLLRHVPEAPATGGTGLGWTELWATVRELRGTRSRTSSKAAKPHINRLRTLITRKA